MSEGVGWPKTLQELGPAIIWWILLLGSGLEGITALVHGDWTAFFASCLIFVVLLVMLINWPIIKSKFEDPRWLVAAAMVGLICLGTSPFIEEKRLPFSAWFESQLSSADISAAKAQQAAEDQRQVSAAQDIARNEKAAREAAERDLSIANQQLGSLQSQVVAVTKERDAAQQSIHDLPITSAHDVPLKLNLLDDLLDRIVPDIRKIPEQIESALDVRPICPLRQCKFDALPLVKQLNGITSECLQMKKEIDDFKNESIKFDDIGALAVIDCKHLTDAVSDYQQIIGIFGSSPPFGIFDADTNNQRNALKIASKEIDDLASDIYGKALSARKKLSQ